MVYRRKRFIRGKPLRRIRRGRVFKRRIYKPTGSGQFGKRYFKLKYLSQINFKTTTSIFDDSPIDQPANSDWTNITKLFDFYRVCAMKIKYNPAWTAQ